MADLRKLWAQIASLAEDDDQEAAETATLPVGGAAWCEGKARFRALHGDGPEIAMSPVEVAAWDMLAKHNFSRAALQREGELSAYEALGIKPELEARWRGDIMAALLDGYPNGLDRVLALIVEYCDAPMLERVAEKLDDSVNRDAIPGKTVLADCERALVTLDAAGLYMPELKQRLLETAKRCAYYDTDGSLRKRMDEISDRWSS